MIGCSPSVIRVPVSPPSVTTSWVGAFLFRFGLGRCAAAVRGGTATRDCPVPNRSVRTTRSVAKMNSQSSARKPNRKIWTTIVAFTGRLLPPARTSGPARHPHRSRLLLPVHQDGVAEPAHVAVLELPTLYPVAVAGRSIGRPQIVQYRARAVEPDLDRTPRPPGARQLQI